MKFENAEPGTGLNSKHQMVSQRNDALVLSPCPTTRNEVQSSSYHNTPPPYEIVCDADEELADIALKKVGTVVAAASALKNIADTVELKLRLRNTDVLCLGRMYSPCSGRTNTESRVVLVSNGLGCPIATLIAGTPLVQVNSELFESLSFRM